MKSPAKLRGIAFLAQVCFFLPALTQAWAETNSGDIHDKYSQGKTEISHNLQGLSHR